MAGTKVCLLHSVFALLAKQLPDSLQFRHLLLVFYNCTDQVKYLTIGLSADDHLKIST